MRTNFWMGFAQVVLILFAALAVFIAAQKLITPANYYRIAAIATVAASGGSLILNPTPTVQRETIAPPALISNSVRPGSVATYNLTVINNKVSSERYRLTAHSSTGWADLSGLPASFNLEPGSSVQFSISVHVPVNASGVSDEMSVVIISTLDSEQESSLLTTKVCADCGK